MSSQDFNMRNVPAADFKGLVKWPLVTKRGKDNTTAYKLYFYLLSRSAVCWGRKEFGEQTYYYISDNQKYWRRSEAAKDIGCIPRTISNNLNRLMEEGLLTKVEGGFRFNSLSCWAPVHWDIMKCFMNLGDFVNWEMMIRFYSVLLYADARGVNQFTFSDITKTFGLRGTTEDHTFLKMCLHWWSYLGLITFTSQQKHHEQFGNYTLYTIQRIENRPTRLTESLASEKEGDQPISNCWAEMLEMHQADLY